MSLKRAFSILLIFSILPFVGCKEKRGAPRLPLPVVEEAPPPNQNRKKVKRKKLEKGASDNFIDFEFAKKKDFPASYIKLVKVNGRGNVLKVKSELDTNTGRLPQYYLHSVVDGESLEELLGNELIGDLYVHHNEEEGVWVNEEPVTFKVEFKNNSYNVSLTARMKNLKTGNVEFTSASLAALDMTK